MAVEDVVAVVGDVGFAGLGEAQGGAGAQRGDASFDKSDGKRHRLDRRSTDRRSELLSHQRRTLKGPLPTGRNPEFETIGQPGPCRDALSAGLSSADTGGGDQDVEAAVCRSPVSDSKAQQSHVVGPNMDDVDGHSNYQMNCMSAFHQRV